jgi:hypothetical protein
MDERRGYVANTVERQVAPTVEDPAFYRDSTGVTQAPARTTTAGKTGKPTKPPSKLKVWFEERWPELLIVGFVLALATLVYNLNGDVRELKGQYQTIKETLPSHKDLDSIQRQNRDDLDRLDQQLRRDLDRLDQRMNRIDAPPAARSRARGR